LLFRQPNRGECGDALGHLSLSTFNDRIAVPTSNQREVSGDRKVAVDVSRTVSELELWQDQGATCLILLARRARFAYTPRAGAEAERSRPAGHLRCTVPGDSKIEEASVLVSLS
jgi:hypothetical protein